MPTLLVLGPLPHPFSPHEGSWLVIEPSITMGVILIAALYLFAVGPLRERYNLAERVEPRQVALFLGGLLIAFVSLQGPLHELSDYYSFAAHMVQHLLVTMIMPPLLLKGLPSWLIDPVLRSRWVYPVARLLLKPAIALAPFTIIFSLWHVPAFYQRALGDPVVHGLEHVLFMTTAIWSWWPIFTTSEVFPRLSEPAQMLYLFIESIIPTILGAIITFANIILYEFYAAAPRVIGLSPLDDQQAAGLLMWLGGASIVLFVLTLRFFTWMNRDSDESLEAARL